MEWADACAVGDLPLEKPVGLRIGTKAIVLVRRGEQVHAVDALCPHKFGPLEDGHVENGLLACPLHDAHFDLSTGAPAPGGVTGATLRVHPVRVADGRVQVQL